jgi:hypothetical protein
MFILDGVAAMTVLDLMTMPGIGAVRAAMTTPPATANVGADGEAPGVPAASGERRTR